MKLIAMVVLGALTFAPVAPSKKKVLLVDGPLDMTKLKLPVEIDRVGIEGVVLYAPNGTLIGAREVWEPLETVTVPVR